MQKIFIVSGENSLIEEMNNLLKEDDKWFVSEISHPNNKGEWLVVLDNEPSSEFDDDY